MCFSLSLFLSLFFFPEYTTDKSFVRLETKPRGALLCKRKEASFFFREEDDTKRRFFFRYPLYTTRARALSRLHLLVLAGVAQRVLDHDARDEVEEGEDSDLFEKSYPKSPETTLRNTSML